MSTAEPPPEAAAHLARLEQAVADVKSARLRLFEVIREIKGRDGVKQVDIERRTGWSREYIRKIAKGEVGPDSDK